MEPWLETELYTLEVPADLPAAPAPAAIEPLSLPRLAGDLLPLLVESTRLDEAFPAYDQLEAETLIAWLQAVVPPEAWLATVDGAPAGFIMLQADLAPLLQRTGGGKRWLQRGYLALRRYASHDLPAGCCWEQSTPSGEARGSGCSCGATRSTGRASWGGR